MACTWEHFIGIWQTNWICMWSQGFQISNQIHKVQTYHSQELIPISTINISTYGLYHNFLALAFPTYSSQQNGCILFLFLVSRRKGIYSQAPFLLKLSCKHHRLVDDQLIDPSTMRVLKRHRREDTFGPPLTG